jgi:hypothetical protein
MAERQEHRATLEEAVRGLAGSGLRVCFELREDAVVLEASAAAPPSEDDLVRRFMAEFDAEEIVPGDDAGPTTQPGGA